MTKKELIIKYKGFYAKIRNLVNDAEIFPELTDSQFEEYVSQEDWMGVPSFSISKRDMTNSDEGHIGIALSEDNIWLTVWFNGVRAVNRFTNILESISYREKEELIRRISRLDSRYKIKVKYTEKFFSASADWKTIMEVNCSNLSDENIEELLKTIKRLKEKRDIRQKEIPDSQVATIAVSLADIDIKTGDDGELKKVLDKLIEILKVTHKIKPTSEINKIERERDKRKKKKESALNKAIGCKQFRNIDSCNPDDEDKCSKCPHDWHKYL